MYIDLYSYAHLLSVQEKNGQSGVVIFFHFKFNILLCPALVLFVQSNCIDWISVCNKPRYRFSGTNSYRRNDKSIDTDVIEDTIENDQNDA